MMRVGGAPSLRRGAARARRSARPGQAAWSPPASPVAAAVLATLHLGRHVGDGDREVARDLVAGRQLDERRNLDRAALLRLEAASPEDAPARRVDRARKVALQHDPGPLLLTLWIRDRHGREQGVRVRVERGRVDHLARRGLDDVAEVHDRDAVRDLPDDREVVGDEEVGDPELALEVPQEVEDLGLDRDVERRDRLVADDQLRLERDRPGDPDPLALAAGELVRVAVVVLRVQADPLHQLQDRAS